MYQISVLTLFNRQQHRFSSSNYNYEGHMMIDQDQAAKILSSLGTSNVFVITPQISPTYFFSFPNTSILWIKEPWFSVDYRFNVEPLVASSWNTVEASKILERSYTQFTLTLIIRCLFLRQNQTSWLSYTVSRSRC